MRLLLDTHALLWVLEDNPQLSPAARAAVADSKADILISAVSGYEISLKYHLGKVPGAAILATDLPARLASADFEQLPVTLDHAQRAGVLDLSHRDPFDRLLAAQAIIEGVPIISKDLAFDKLGAQRLW